MNFCCFGLARFLDSFEQGLILKLVLTVGIRTQNVRWSVELVGRSMVARLVASPTRGEIPQTNDHQT